MRCHFCDLKGRIAPTAVLPIHRRPAARPAHIVERVGVTTTERQAGPPRIERLGRGKLTQQRPRLGRLRGFGHAARLFADQAATGGRAFGSENSRPQARVNAGWRDRMHLNQMMKQVKPLGVVGRRRGGDLPCEP